MRLVTLPLSLGALPLAACSPDVAAGGTSSTGGAADRPTFLPPVMPAWAPIPLHFINAQKPPYDVVGGGDCSGDPFSLSAAGGAGLLSSGDACGLTCAARETNSCVCAVDGAVSHAFYVAPEGSLNATWQGSIFTETALLAGDFNDTTCVDMCLVESAARGKLAW
jgi:hypothetical protein